LLLQAAPGRPVHLSGLQSLLFAAALVAHRGRDILQIPFTSA
jgi:hypothetical protein